MSPVEETYFDMAKSFETQGNYEKALVWYKKITGDADVYEKIGEFLYFGRGCGKDDEEAKKYFELAAELDNTDALCNLALMENTLDKKIVFYKRAAEKDSAYAMNMLGIIYEEKEGQGAEQALECFKKAADSGSVEGCYNYVLNTEDPAEKIQYLKKASEQEYVLAMKKYADCLREGQYCDKNPAKAEEIMKKLRSIKKEYILGNRKLTEAESAMILKLFK